MMRHIDRSGQRAALRHFLISVFLVSWLALGPSFSAVRAEASVSSGIPGDGTYLVGVTLEGGSGKAAVSSPCTVISADGALTARIEFSSPYYDYLIMDGTRYDPVNEEGNSVFEIPLKEIGPVEIIADTTAMSTPHEIAYTLEFDASGIVPAGDGAGGETSETLFDPASAASTKTMPEKEAPVSSPEPEKTALADGSASENGFSSGKSASGNGFPSGESASENGFPSGESTGDSASEIRLLYAREFTAVRNADGSCDVTIGEDHYHIGQSYEKIYCAASSAMDLFLAAGAISHVASTGTKDRDWGIAEIRQLVEDGTIAYAGKYSAPDYEYLLASGCDLAVESTMIYHTPEVREKLESLGIPVLVERSSYETEPLARMEWIKLYGLLTGHYEEAEAYFNEKVREAESLGTHENTGKSVVFFYIGSNGQPVVRKPGD